MNPDSLQKLWNGLGWLSIALVLIAIPYGLIDGVMGIFVLYVAIVVGGLSGIGLSASTRFGFLTIGASLVLGMLATNSSGSAGFRAPGEIAIRDAFAIFAIPILVSSVFLLAGAIRRSLAGDK